MLVTSGFAVTGNVDGQFQSVRLYDEPPHGVMLSKDKCTTRERELFFKGCRDDDLLLLSCHKIDLKGKDDIKQVGDARFILEVLEQPGAMLAFVKTKWIKGNGFIHLLVDREKARYL